MKLENYQIDDNIFSSSFACDLEHCKGACCTFYGIDGAPLQESEIEEIAKNLDAAKEYLSQTSIKYIDNYGFAKKGLSGELTTQCINYRDCVFVYYEGDIAKCAIEKAYVEGKSSFRKPISCHLFPVRVYDDSIYYEKIIECEPGQEKGQQENIQLIDFLAEPIERKFGKEFYNKLKNNSV
ncbi:MAG TPA: DUF3109 family protein [Candidatus Kapabacteria bacterium]|nr:DUF3109 family protein [Candidatus Kapabacteria bacterium]